jgi:hypothetical protein
MRKTYIFSVLIFATAVLLGCASNKTVADSDADLAVLNIINSTGYQIKQAYSKENIDTDQQFILPKSKIKAGATGTFYIKPGQWVIVVVFDVNGIEVEVQYEAVMLRGIEYRWELTVENVNMPETENSPEN